MSPAIYFEPDGYVLEGKRIMGRQSAGNGFLRAAVAAHAGRAIHGVSPTPASEAEFRQLIQAMDPAARPEWIPGHRLDLIARHGVFYRPDQILGPAARIRLRAGPVSYSICGITHTLATFGTLEALADLQTAPVGPWDALICTSQAALQVVETVLGAQADYLAWRLGAPAPALLPQLPVIPLGVHCDDFASTPEARGQARADLQIEDDEVVALFAGRLSVAGKAHPIPMYQGLERVARKTGKRLVILHAGAFFNAAIERQYHSAVAQFCPGVRAIFVKGSDADAYRSAWRAADYFISLADSIQETFGLTPVEAMAAGLPALVTDWNGYRDTIRDGLDGFRITTWAPATGGAIWDLSYEARGEGAYDYYLSQASTTVSVDAGMLDDRLTQLVTDEGLRRRLGASGQAHARAVYDWSVVYRQYEALWAELDARRAEAQRDRSGWLAAAPRGQAGALGAFRTFESYPTGRIGGATLVRLAPAADMAAFQRLTAHPLYSFWNPDVGVVAAIFGALAAGPRTVHSLSDAVGQGVEQTGEAVARLAKLNLVALSGG